MIYAFDDSEVDLRRYELRRDGRARRIEPQVFDVLVLLVRERDRVVTKEEILDTVWGDRFVSESALTSRIKALRQALGDDGKAQRLVRTVRGRGYQFVAEVDERGGHPAVTPTALAPDEPPPQEIRFCTTDDGVRLAYATTGAGPPLVKVANWLSHLDYDRETVVWRHWLRELSSRHRLIRYDERGCGLSDWDVPDFSLEAWVRDLETVVDAAGPVGPDAGRVRPQRTRQRLRTVAGARLADPRKCPAAVGQLQSPVAGARPGLASLPRRGRRVPRRGRATDTAADLTTAADPHGTGPLVRTEARN